jgi:hypothetical protein
MCLASFSTEGSDSAIEVLHPTAEFRKAAALSEKPEKPLWYPSHPLKIAVPEVRHA